jgi:hypothetical protein
MIGVRMLAMSIAWVAISSSVLSAPDLSRYREFRLGPPPQNLWVSDQGF